MIASGKRQNDNKAITGDNVSTRQEGQKRRKKNRLPVYGWNKECEDAIKRREEALQN